MGEHEDRSMKDGVVAPPPFPLVVLPGAALWSELVAPHDLDADARPPVTCEGLVNPRVSARLVVHRVESSCGEEPLHQSAGGVSEGGIETLSLPRAKPVKGNREVVYAHLRHSRDLPRTPLTYLYRLTNIRIDGAVGLYFLAGCEAHRAHLAVLGHTRKGRIARPPGGIPHRCTYDLDNTGSGAAAGGSSG